MRLNTLTWLADLFVVEGKLGCIHCDLVGCLVCEVEAAYTVTWLAVLFVVAAYTDLVDCRVCQVVVAYTDLVDCRVCQVVVAYTDLVGCLVYCIRNVRLHTL